MEFRHPCSQPLRKDDLLFVIVIMVVMLVPPAMPTVIVPVTPLPVLVWICVAICGRGGVDNRRGFIDYRRRPHIHRCGRAQIYANIYVCRGCSGRACNASSDRGHNHYSFHDALSVEFRLRLQAKRNITQVSMLGEDETRR